ncbi:MAG TPA: hypothetical protein VLV49_00700 [Terriglobales bacterium]|nr:hypothetical protein [Terriglobales bacterium]
MTPTKKIAVSVCLLGGLISLSRGQDANKLKVPASCKVLYSMVEEDALHNINQGLIASGFKEKGGLKWLEKMYKKYPDVCYVSPNTKESVVFFIIATPAVYHGTRVETETHNTQSTTTGTVSDNEGNTADVNTNTTGTTEDSVAVPYEVNYNSFTLTVERKTKDGHFEPLRHFKVDGLYRSLYGLSWGKGKHPIANVMEDAIKWIHEGGLNNSNQRVME